MIEMTRRIREYVQKLIERSTSGSFSMKAAIVWRRHLLHARARASESMGFLWAPASAPLPPFTAPEKGCGVLVPVCGHGPEPLVNLRRALGALPIQSAPFQDALHRFGPIESTAAQGRI
jgi:hypothetical protein